MAFRKKVGDYEFNEKIGEGAFGEVLKGFHIATKKPVAGKVIKNTSLDEKFTKYLKREISTLKSISCDYIIKLFNVLQTASNTYVITELCEGGNLKTYLTKFKNTIPENLAKKWIHQILQALCALKENRIMHRDIKLANVVLTKASPEGDAKLADFGFARFVGQNSMVTTLLGTPMFMAPEILRNEKYTYKADIWSLGILAYEMLTGTLPFKSRTIQQLKKLQTSELWFPADCRVSDQGKEVVRLMLTYDTNSRPHVEQLTNHPYFTESETFVNDPNLYVINETDEDMENSLVLGENKEVFEKCIYIDFQLNSLKNLLSVQEPNDFNLFARLGISFYCNTQVKNLLDEASEMVGGIPQGTEEFQEVYDQYNECVALNENCQKVLNEIKEHEQRVFTSEGELNPVHKGLIANRLKQEYTDRDMCSESIDELVIRVHLASIMNEMDPKPEYQDLLDEAKEKLQEVQCEET